VIEDRSNEWRWPRKVLVRHVTALCVAALLAPMVHAQTAMGRLDGTVRAAGTDAAIPYAVVSVASQSRERFTGADGRFSLLALPVGTYTVVIKRLGFAPWNGSVAISADASTALAVVLTPIAARLPKVDVIALANCANPGLPDPRRQADVYELVTLLRENADRYRILASQYPFSYLQTRALGELSDSAFILQRIDTTLVTSASPASYRPGQVVTRARGAGGRGEYTMILPTIVELAGDPFIRNHCFGYGGAITQQHETWYRINVRAADRLKSPDVHGAFFLDSATSQLRRMELELSRPDRLPRELRGIDGVTAVTTFVSIADGLSVIGSVCAVNRLTQQGAIAKRPTPSELQRLIAVRFTSPPPDVPAVRTLELPPWQSGARLPRSEVGCID